MRTVTYTELQTFNDCQRRHWWRYERCIQPVRERREALFLGGLVHGALERYHGGQGMEAALDWITGEQQSACEAWEQEACAQARAIVWAYQAHWIPDALSAQIGETEHQFQVCLGRETTLMGKIDAIATVHGEVWLVEHKTASVVDDGYLSRLWCDFQIWLYAWAYEQETGRQVSGVIYNILPKPKIKWDCIEETPEAFEVRRAEAAAKNKSGTTNIKRKTAETLDAYEARCYSWLLDKGGFHREPMPADREKMDTAKGLALSLSLDTMLGTRRQNPSQCFKWGRACPYFPLCRAGDNCEMLVDTMYESCEAHPELENENDRNGEEVF